MKEIVRIIGFSLLSSLLIFIGKNDMALKWLVEKNILSNMLDLDKVQFWCFATGFFWAGLWLPIEHYLVKSKQRKKDEQFIGLLSYNKESYFKLIKNKLKNHNIVFNTRIFRPQKGIVGWWNRNACKKVILELITVKGISDEFHYKSLHFEINKDEIQGLVGKCYSDRKLWVDLNLATNNYSLTEQHKSKIGNVEFCSAIPIFSKDQKKVNAILSIDSQNKLDFSDDDKKEWEEHMIYYGAFVDKHTNL